MGLRRVCCSWVGSTSRPARGGRGRSGVASSDRNSDAATLGTGDPRSGGRRRSLPPDLLADSSPRVGRLQRQCSPRARPTLGGLTEREVAFLRLIAEGPRPLLKWAAKLYFSDRTVKNVSRRDDPGRLRTAPCRCLRDRQAAQSSAAHSRGGPAPRQSSLDRPVVVSARRAFLSPGATTRQDGSRARTRPPC